jgi:hypothetical protein
MSKIVLAGFILFVVIGCSDKQEELKPKKLENNETKKDIKKDVKMDTNKTKKKMMVIEEEFIPDHIKHSHIEVVEHY